MAIEWTDVLKISLSSSVLSAGVGWTLNHAFVYRASLKRDARYLAHRVAIVLEKFSSDCAHLISDNDMFLRSNGDAGSSRASLPELGAFPSDADWKALSPKLAYRALSLPSQLSLADDKISFWWDVVGDEDCMRNEATRQAGLWGSRAWDLASDFRKAHKLSESALQETSWNFLKALRDQAALAEVDLVAQRHNAA